MPLFSPFRAALMMICIVLGLTALLGRVAYLQTYGREQTIQRAERQQHSTEPLISRRGNIFDRNGILMAGTVQTSTLFVDPSFLFQVYQQDGRSLVDLDDAIEKLAEVIGADSFELARLLGRRSEARFVKLAENLDELSVRHIRELNIPGIGIQPTNVRYYPAGSVAAHVLGGVGKDGTGLEGLELKFEKILAGRDGYKRTLKTARRQGLSVAAEDYLPPQHGRHLMLTIDSNIQLIAEQELAAACRQYKAVSGEVVVIDPRNGDILALANYPTFNPQNLEDSTAEMRLNRAIVVPYEPGSTLKPFLVGPALAERITRADEVFPIHGPSYKSSLRSKPVIDVHPYPSLATWDVLVKSSNIGMVMLAERMGKERMWNALAGFRFGRKTGIELPGEDPGLLRAAKNWGNSDMVSTAQGYSMMVTPLQLARAFCAYANGGRLITPRIVKGTLDATGAIVKSEDATELQMLPEVVDPITAAEVKRILSDVPIRGTGTKARSHIWNIFGKTGTAHVAKAGSYNESSYTSSFVGGAPAENPRVVIALIIHEPDRGIAHYGGVVSAPAAGRVIERTLAYLQVPASPDLPLPPSRIADVLYGFNPNQYKRKPSQWIPHAMQATTSARD